MSVTIERPARANRSPRQAPRKPTTSEEHWIFELYCAGHEVNPEAAAKSHLRSILMRLRAGKPLFTVQREMLAKALEQELGSTTFTKAFSNFFAKVKDGKTTRSRPTLARDAWIAMDYVLRTMEIPDIKATALGKNIAIDWQIANKHARKKNSQKKQSSSFEPDRESTVAEAVRRFGGIARQAIHDHMDLMMNVYEQAEEDVLAGFRDRTNRARMQLTPKI